MEKVGLLGQQEFADAKGLSSCAEIYAFFGLTAFVAFHKAMILSMATKSGHYEALIW